MTKLKIIINQNELSNFEMEGSNESLLNFQKNSFNMVDGNFIKKETFPPCSYNDWDGF